MYIYIYICMYIYIYIYIYIYLYIVNLYFLCRFCDIPTVSSRNGNCKLAVNSHLL